MRVFTNMIENLTDLIRFVVAAFVLCGFLFGLFMTAGASYVAPKVAESVAEDAMQFSEHAMIEARDAQREREMAREGWGYDSANAGRAGLRDRNGEPAGGWGEESN